MAVMTDNVTAGRVLSATVQYDNSDNTQRSYDIKGEVYVSNQTFQNINNGYVTAIDDEEQTPLASFSSYGDSNLSITFYTTENEAVVAIINAVLGFLADVKADIQSKSNNA